MWAHMWCRHTGIIHNEALGGLVSILFITRVLPF